MSQCAIIKTSGVNRKNGQTNSISASSNDVTTTITTTATTAAATTASATTTTAAAATATTTTASTTCSSTIKSEDNGLQQTSTTENDDKINETSSASNSISKHVVDKLFDPSVEMMVEDYDDERTLEEEEALAAGEAQDPHAELSNLQREGDMPLAELLKLYGLDRSPTGGVSGADLENGSAAGTDTSSSGATDLDTGDNDQVVNKSSTSVAANNICTSTSGGGSNGNGGSNTNTTSSSSLCGSLPKSNLHKQSALSQLYEPLPDTPESEQDGARILRSVSRTHSEIDIEEEDDDYDYSPDEDEWKKTIMVGSDYQAAIPEGLCCYDDALPYENEDKLLWDPTPLSPKQVEDYLKQVRAKKKRGAGVYALPVGNHLKDDEQALFLLLQCGHNIDEALRRRRINAITSAETMSLWSEEECRNFENGLRNYGKDFHLIQQNKVRTRSVGELVQFYYLWKKTERHDVFANKTRLEKKKYTLHPGITDFMDRFLDEQDQLNNQERSASPYVFGGSDTKTKSTIQMNDKSEHSSSTTRNTSSFTTDF